jgi:hypothetical protein
LRRRGREPEGYTLTPWRILYAAMALFCLASVPLVVLVVQWQTQTSPASRWLGAPIATLLLFAIVATGSASIIRARSRSSSTYPDERAWGWGALACGLPAGLAVVLAATLSHMDAGVASGGELQTTPAWRYSRMLDVGNGLSPLAPIALLALPAAVAFAGGYRRLGPLSRKSEIEKSLEKRRQYDSPIGERLASLTRDRLGAGAAVPLALTLVGTVVLLRRFAWPLERLALPDPVARAVILALAAGLIGVLAFLAWTTYRLASTWSRLRGFLEGIDNLGLGEAFKRLPRHVAAMASLGPFGGDLTGDLERQADLASERDPVRRELRDILGSLERQNPNPYARPPLKSSRIALPSRWPSTLKGRHTTCGSARLSCSPRS